MQTLRRTSSRGFTLVELLIVVAIVGTLAALAILGYRRYLSSAQSAEARAVMGQIRAGEEQYRAETLAYLGCSTSLSDYYPNATPDDSRWSWKRSTDTRYNNSTNGWAMLNVNPDGPVRYGYAVVANVGPNAPPALDSDWKSPPIFPTPASGVPWYVVEARNVHVAGAKPNLLLTSSFDGTILSYGDGN